MKTTILGAGKVGRTLARALRRAGEPALLAPVRRGLPRARITGDLLVLAVRDASIAEIAGKLADRGQVDHRTAVVHVSGALPPDVLSPLRGGVAGIGQAHPLLSFASASAPPELRGGLLWVRGDAEAVKRARRLARILGMKARGWPDVDATLYHAAAGLLANGSATLAAGAAQILERAGAPELEAARMLGPLLRSVADNVERLGVPAALTGPIRRGDVRTVAAHIEGLSQAAPEWLPLYIASALAQVRLARALGDASSRDLARLARLLAGSAKRSRPRDQTR